MSSLVQARRLGRAAPSSYRRQCTARCAVPVTAAQAPQVPPAAHISGIAGAFIHSKALYSAAKLGVADVLGERAMPVAELAAAVRAKPDQLRRVLRLLAALGVFEETSPGTFANNGASDTLRTDHPSSTLYMVLHLGLESYLAHTYMYEGMLESHPALAFSDLSGGLDCWEWMSLPENKEIAEVFDKAMAASSAAAAPRIVEGYDWGRHSGQTLADVGGGTGRLLAAILRQQPSMRGILFERPEVIARARELWAQECGDLADRIRFEEGSFFESVPQADAYLMKSILHDWADEPCIQILKTIRRALGDKGAGGPPRLLLAEGVIEEAQPVNVGKARMDLQMMVIVGGKERTEREWRELLEAGGFALTAAAELPQTFYSIISAQPL